VATMERASEEHISRTRTASKKTWSVWFIKRTEAERSFSGSAACEQDSGFDPNILPEARSRSLWTRDRGLLWNNWRGTGKGLPLNEWPRRQDCDCGFGDRGCELVLLLSTHFAAQIWVGDHQPRGPVTN